VSDAFFYSTKKINIGIKTRGVGKNRRQVASAFL